MWTCSSCQNPENEESWEACWKCGQSKSGATVSVPPSPQVMVQEVEGTLAERYETTQQRALAFASSVGKDRLISISHERVDSRVIYLIWYWAR